MVKKKIAVIGLKGLPAYGGAATVGENIIDQLKDKYEFIVYETSSHTAYKTGIHNGIYHIVFKKLPFKKINTLYYYVVSAFHSFIWGRYDLIHLHHRDAAFIIVLLKLKYKVILTIHNSFFVVEKWKNFEWFFKLNEKYFVKKADIVTCVSKKDKEQFKSLLNLDLIFVPNGINIIKNQSDQPAADKYDYKSYLFWGAGRIIKMKGLDILLRAIKKINLECKLLVAGDLDQTPNYKKEILALSKNVNVEYLGLIKNKNDLFEYIRHAKFFIFPSTYETMSMMLLETASLKTPIICSDIPANKAVFNDDQVLYFHVNDPSDLASKIEWALVNGQEMKKKSEKAFDHLQQKYQWKDIVKEYNKLYQQLL